MADEPDTAGPSKDANLNVVFVDLLTVQNPDGTPGESYRVAGVVVPAKKKGTDATVPMVVTGFASTTSHVPEPTVPSRSPRHRGPTYPHRSRWDERRGRGNSSQRRRSHPAATAICSRGHEQGRNDTHSASSRTYRIYRIEQAAGVRSTAAGTDRAQKTCSRRRSVIANFRRLGATDQHHLAAVSRQVS